MAEELPRAYSEFKGLGSMWMKVLSKGSSINFVNVYAPCNTVSRREVWKSLIWLKNQVAGEEWCIGDDFNTVLFKEERIGKNVGRNGRDNADFFNFVKEMELIDLPCVGGRFTWFSGIGCAMSRLDHFLLTDNLVYDWKLDNQMVGKRVPSDHCPVWLKSGGWDWGLKPFRFNNGWYKHEDFPSFVSNE